MGEGGFQAFAFLGAEGDVGVAPDVGLDIGGPPYQLRAAPSGFEVGPHDGGTLDATLRADPAYILGLAAGALTVSDVLAFGLAEIDGDEAVVRAVFAA
ncbi:hypothetical protein IU487_17370 [Nocardia puris]|uniref:hypothetical protein n=1 Tax=Nocardia puris TaxID=208602 RepID=UPI001893E182|nr:hypothetical protein [Nocardia puris]MBF6212800.1 hypothetical protein [Nocardia puris]